MSDNLSSKQIQIKFNAFVNARNAVDVSPQCKAVVDDIIDYVEAKAWWEEKMETVLWDLRTLLFRPVHTVKGLKRLIEWGEWWTDGRYGDKRFFNMLGALDRAHLLEHVRVFSRQPAEYKSKFFTLCCHDESCTLAFLSCWNKKAKKFTMREGRIQGFNQTHVTFDENTWVPIKTYSEIVELSLKGQSQLEDKLAHERKKEKGCAIYGCGLPSYEHCNKCKQFLCANCMLKMLRFKWGRYYFFCPYCRAEETYENPYNNQVGRGSRMKRLMAATGTKVFAMKVDCESADVVLYLQECHECHCEIDSVCFDCKIKTQKVSQIAPAETARFRRRFNE